MDRNKLIEDNLGLARKVANYYSEKNKRYEYEEFLSLAQLGIVKASKSFDESKGYKFSTLAYKSAQNEILWVLTRDKTFNYKRGVPMEEEMLPASLNIIINEDSGTKCELVDTISDNYTNEYEMSDIIDLIERISKKNKHTKKGLKIAERNINIIKDYIIRGYDYTYIGKRHRMTSARIGQVVNDFIKEAKKYI